MKVSISIRLRLASASISTWQMEHTYRWFTAGPPPNLHPRWEAERQTDRHMSREVRVLRGKQRNLPDSTRRPPLGWLLPARGSLSALLTTLARTPSRQHAHSTQQVPAQGRCITNICLMAKGWLRDLTSSPGYWAGAVVAKRPQAEPWGHQREVAGRRVDPTVCGVLIHPQAIGQSLRLTCK